MPMSDEAIEAEYRAFISKGDLRLQTCTACSYVRPPTSWTCPECLSESWSWTPISGGGEIEACTWYMQPFDPRFTDVPYNVALVRLDEGVRMVANVLNVAPGEIAPGQRVAAVSDVGRMGSPVISFKPGAPAGSTSELRAAT